MGYLRGSQKHFIDMLVYRLLRKLFVIFVWGSRLLKDGLSWINLNSTIRRQLGISNEVSSDTANWIKKRCWASFGGDDDYVEIISFRSFENKSIRYIISSNACSSLSHCSCPFMTETDSVCKHMVPTEWKPGYSKYCHGWCPWWEIRLL